VTCDARPEDITAFAEGRGGCRLLTTDFRAGDVCVFGMFTLHGSLDNRSPIGRVRISGDVRYQPAADRSTLATSARAPEARRAPGTES
jgi:hypothetical protein